MHASVTIITARPDKIDEVIKVYRDSVVPAFKKQKGFKGYYVLTDYNTGKGMSISLWNTDADMMANENSEFQQDQAAKVVPTLSGTPTIEHYEVSVRG